MTLKEWFAATGVKQNWFAKKVEVGTDSMSLYVQGRRIPTAAVQMRIQKATNGEVAVDRDWPELRRRRRVGASGKPQEGARRDAG